MISAGDGPLIDDEHPVGQGEGLLRVMGDDDGGQVVLPGDGLDPVLDGLLDHPVQGGEGLVQQEDAGLHHHGAGQGHPLLLAAGELVHPLVQVVLQAQEVDEFLHLFLGGDAGLVLQPIGDVLVDVQVGEQGVVLEDDVKAALFHHRPGEVLSVIHNGAGVGLYDAQDDVQQGGLAAAGRA